jgi:ATP-dependent Clp protease ATP-binding subunit ClpC
MFERYTERARRALFFARYEASQMGSVTLEPEHILLGLLREPRGIIGPILSRAHLALEQVATDLYERSSHREKVATSVEIPFTAAARRVLTGAAEEADRLRHGYIGTEHLLLGLLREDAGAATDILHEHGLHLENVRAEVARIDEGTGEHAPGAVSADDTRMRIVFIRAMVDRLAEATPGSRETAELVETIANALDDLGKRLP